MSKFISSPQIWLRWSLLKSKSHKFLLNPQCTTFYSQEKSDFYYISLYQNLHNIISIWFPHQKLFLCIKPKPNCLSDLVRFGLVNILFSDINYCPKYTLFLDINYCPKYKRFCSDLRCCSKTEPSRTGPKLECPRTELVRFSDVDFIVFNEHLIYD